jgi:transcriptional regulator with XRE-family HTH domain
MARTSTKSKSDRSRRQITPARTPSEADHIVAQRIRSIRKSAGLSLSDMGEQLGLSQQQCQKYETGANRISVGKLLDMAEILNVAPEGLIANLGKPSSQNQELETMKMEGMRLLMGLEHPRQVETVVAMLRGLSVEDPPKRSARR